MVGGNRLWTGGGINTGTSMVLKNNKSLGQHWLKNRFVLDDIASLARIGPAKLAKSTKSAKSAKPVKSTKSAPEVTQVQPTCLEIGPGLGTLTSSLLRVFPKVIAVEFDERLAHNLPNSFPGKNLEVVNADFLDFDLNKIKEPYVVAGNIPYYITSPIIMKLLQTENRPLKITLLIQKEVAERIAARKGKHTVISLSAQNLAKVSLGPVVERDLFTPPPKVDSQVIILEPKPAEVSPEVIKLVKRGFSAPRKKLIKNLGVEKTKLIPIFNELDFSPDIRPSDLDLTDWKKLQAALTKKS